MYPVLVATGGIATLLWDYRYKIASFVQCLPGGISNRRARQAARLGSTTSVVNDSPTLQNAAQGMELQDNPSRLASLRRRGAAAATVTSTAVLSSSLPQDVSTSNDYRQDIDLVTLKKKYAVPLAILFVVMVVVLVVVRAEIPHPPRWLDFFVNMVIAGVIIFGGGPVVIPLLRGYTVTPGMSHSIILD